MLTPDQQRSRLLGEMFDAEGTANLDAAVEGGPDGDD